MGVSESRSPALTWAYLRWDVTDQKMTVDASQPPLSQTEVLSMSTKSSAFVHVNMHLLAVIRRDQWPKKCTGTRLSF